jgi:hypothetical protein
MGERWENERRKSEGRAMFGFFLGICFSWLKMNKLWLKMAVWAVFEAFESLPMAVVAMGQGGL